MKKYLKFALLFIVGIIFVACDKDSVDGPDPGDDIGKIIIPSEEFTLPEGCRWSYAPQYFRDTVYRVDNADDLRKMVIDNSPGNLIIYDGEIEFDFENKTLLVAYFGTGVYKTLSGKLYVREDHETDYQFDVIIDQYGPSANVEAIYMLRNVALSVDKMDSLTSVSLNVIIKNPNFGL